MLLAFVGGTLVAASEYIFASNEGKSIWVKVFMPPAAFCTVIVQRITFTFLVNYCVIFYINTNDILNR